MFAGFLYLYDSFISFLVSYTRLMKIKIITYDTVYSIVNYNKLITRDVHIGYFIQFKDKMKCGFNIIIDNEFIFHPICTSYLILIQQVLIREWNRRFSVYRKPGEKPVSGIPKSGFYLSLKPVLGFYVKIEYSYTNGNWRYTIGRESSVHQGICVQVPMSQAEFHPKRVIPEIPIPRSKITTPVPSHKSVMYHYHYHLV